MTHLHALPELVRDSQLKVIVQGQSTIHTAPLECRDSVLPQFWETTEPIGRGGDGTVFLQRKIKGPGNVEILAVKQMMLKADLASEDNDSKRYVRELEALSKFAQGRYARHFVRSYGWYEHRRMLYICMEYCKHLDLGTYLKTCGILPEETAKTIAVQVIHGLQCMHDNEIAHRDLKPANILIHRKPPEDIEWWVVLGDLGLSRRSGASSGSTTIHGTPNFMAPETIGKPFLAPSTGATPFSADIWCLGETISCALTGHGTFLDDEHLLQYQRYQMSFPDDLLRRSGASVLAIDFLRSLMQVDPSRRLTTAQALDHPWFIANHIPNMHTPLDSSVSMVHNHGTGMLRNSNETTQVKDANDNTNWLSNPKPSTLNHATQASAQWTQTIPMHSQYTQASAMWTRTVANPTMQTSRSNVLDHPTVRQRTPETVVSQKKEEPGLEKAPSPIPASSKAESYLQDSDLKLEAAAKQHPVGNSVMKLSKAGDVLTSKQRSLASKNKQVKLDDLKRFGRNFSLSTPIPPDLIPILSKDEEKQRKIAASAEQDAIKHKRNAEEKHKRTLKPPASPAVKPNPQAPQWLPNDAHVPMQRPPNSNSIPPPMGWLPPIVLRSYPPGQHPYPAPQHLPTPAPQGQHPYPASQHLPTPAPQGQHPYPAPQHLPTPAPPGQQPYLAPQHFYRAENMPYLPPHIYYAEHRPYLRPQYYYAAGQHPYPAGQHPYPTGQHSYPTAQYPYPTAQYPHLAGQRPHSAIYPAGQQPPPIPASNSTQPNNPLQPPPLPKAFSETRLSTGKAPIPDKEKEAVRQQEQEGISTFALQKPKAEAIGPSRSETPTTSTVTSGNPSPKAEATVSSTTEEPYTPVVSKKKRRQRKNSGG